MKTKKEKICLVVALVVTLAVIAVVVVAGVRNKHKNEQPDTPPVNSETVDTSGETETSDIPNIPVIDPSTVGGEDEHPNDNPGDVQVDVEKPDGAPKPKEPYVEGEVVIIPGLKEVDENETQN